MEKYLPAPLSNEAILASAGTGKTFTLAMRFLTLLHYGVKPSSILASTFTNKAAGEIFDKLIEELRHLAEDEEKIALLVQSGHLPETFTKDSALALLRMLLQGKEDLNISTLDSFFLNIIRAFPLECGIRGEVTLLEEGDTALQDQALLQWIRRAGKEERAILREMMKNASFGAENKSLYKVLQQLIKNLYATFLLAPEKRLYGGYNPFLASLVPVEDILKEEELEALLENFYERFLEGVPAIAGNRTFTSYIKQYLQDVSNLPRQHKLSENAEKFREYILRGNEGIFQMQVPPETLTFTYSRKNYEIAGQLLQDLLRILKHVRALMIYRALERTKSIYDLLEAFHKEFSLIGRTRGYISFDDIPYLLRPDEKSDLALPFSERAGVEERLDAAIDHYMLDEFQDTSDAQYRAMERLLDEVIADPSGARSFFYVGDIKQSIYQWREGNPGLFEMIFHKYLSYEDRAVRKKFLSLSYRSGKGVLDAVNAVFGAPVPATDPLTLQAMERMQFTPHLPSKSAEKQNGTAVLFEVSSPASSAAQENKAKAVYTLLQKLDPFRRKKPLTVGILFRKNKSAQDFAEFFRNFYAEDLAAGKKGLPPLHLSMDGKLPVTESPLFVLYSHLILLADHPEDEFAKGYLRLLRFGEEPLPPAELLKKLRFAEEGEEILHPLERLASGIRMDWDKGSYSLFLERFLAAFRKESGHFDLARMEAVKLVTSDLAVSGKKVSSDTYRHLLENASAHNTSLRGTIQMMTVHKSKGLDFDIVIMPELNPKNPSRNYLTPHIAKDETFHTRYISFLPGEGYGETFPEFREEQEKEKLANTYENCCNLYVGMTRARYALYLFADERGANAKTYQQREILYETFGARGKDLSLFPEEAKLLQEDPSGVTSQVIAYTGDPLWYKVEEEVKEKKSAALTVLSAELAGKCLKKYVPGKVKILPPSPVTEFITPSSFHGKKEKEKDAEKKESPAATLSFRSNSHAALGTRLHEIMEKFPFAGEITREEFFRKYLTEEERSPASVISTLLDGFFREDSPLYQALLPPAKGQTTLWKEKEFLLAGKEEGKIFSGIFDRVHLIREEGEMKAVIFDYKSDLLHKEEDFLALYTRQIQLYMAALKKMLSLPGENIKAYILALQMGKAIEVPRP